MKITFIIGGAKSGKSSFALAEASRAKGRKAFIATAEALDDEMNARIKNHQLERGDEWTTYEKPVEVIPVLEGMGNRYEAAVLDCLTLWLSNVVVREENREHKTQSVADIIEKLAEDLSGLKKSNSGPRLYIVSNEVGTGIVPENRLARQFRDYAGRLNQKVAGIADEVYLVTAGIPLKIK